MRYHRRLVVAFVVLSFACASRSQASTRHPAPSVALREDPSVARDTAGNLLVVRSKVTHQDRGWETRLFAFSNRDGRWEVAGTVLVEVMEGSSPVAPPDTELFRHLVADVDSVPLAWENRWTSAIRVFIDPRTRATPVVATDLDSPFVAAPEGVTSARVAAIRRAGMDTATTPPWSACPGMLLPDARRDGCPASGMVIYAFSDTLRLGTSAPDGATSREWVVIVNRTYLNPNGRQVAEGRYTVSRGASGWRTLSRRLVGFIE